MLEETLSRQLKVLKQSNLKIYFLVIQMPFVTNFFLLKNLLKKHLTYSEVKRETFSLI